MDQTPSDLELHQLAADVGVALERAGRRLALAESCTGGWVARVVTAIAGSSGWFERGFVTYSNEAKQEMLGVAAATINRHGAVSEPTARAMAEGALARSHADVALAITGIAGPSGGTPEKPIGMVWFAWATKENGVSVRCCQLTGDRETVRRKSVAIGLEGLLDVLRKE